MKSEVFNIDCMIGMKETPDNYYDLAVVDPWYGVSKIMKRDLKPNQLYFKEIFRISQNQIIWGMNHFNLPPTKNVIVWYKRPFLDSNEAELAWVSPFDNKIKVFDYLYAGNCEGTNRKVDYKKKNIHPYQKPIALYKWIFKNYAKEGQKILDTHLGSGSSRIAAYNYRLDFTGYEIEKDYFDAAEKRFKNHIESNKFKDDIWNNKPAITKQVELFNKNH